MSGCDCRSHRPASAWGTLGRKCSCWSPKYLLDLCGTWFCSVTIEHFHSPSGLFAFYFSSPSMSWFFFLSLPKTLRQENLGKTHGVVQTRKQLLFLFVPVWTRIIYTGFGSFAQNSYWRLSQTASCSPTSHHSPGSPYFLCHRMPQINPLILDTYLG